MWKRVLGIVGGIGPHAHIELERRLLAAVEAVAGDQSYPPWILSSIPATPDRTAALLGGGASPVPLLQASLERLQRAGADFAVLACNTIYAFLDEIGAEPPLPILHMIEETVLEIARLGAVSRIGLLATTGTLQSGVYAKAIERYAPQLRPVSLLDLPGGERLQDDLVMHTIYGSPSAEGRRGGLKAGFLQDPVRHRAYSDCLLEACTRLVENGADCIVLGCTEVSLGLARVATSGLRLIDPMDVVVREILAIAQGERPLPRRLSLAVGPPSPLT